MKAITSSKHLLALYVLDRSKSLMHALFVPDSLRSKGMKPGSFELSKTPALLTTAKVVNHGADPSDRGVSFKVRQRKPGLNLRLHFLKAEICTF